jgi:ABC-type multidrug transport system fused ATPase/permease subunit
MDNFLEFYLSVLVIPFWKLYFITGLVGSLGSFLTTFERNNVISLFNENESNKGAIILKLGTLTLLNGCRTGLLTYLKHKGYISTVSYFFDHVCLQKLEIWDKYYNKGELTKCVYTDISVFVETTIKIYSIIIRNTISTILLLYFLTIDRYEYILFALFICILRSYFLEVLVRYWEHKNDKVKSIKKDVEKYLSEYISSNTSMQIYGLGDIYKKIVSQILTEYDNIQFEDSLWYGVFIFSFMTLMRFIDIGVYLINLYTGSNSNDSVQITLSYFTLLSESIQSLSDIQKEIKRNKDSIMRLSKYTNVPETPVVQKLKAIKSRDFEIKFKDIHFSYPTRNVPIYSHFNQTISEGEWVALIGESGRGKTTLIKLLLGLYKPDRGLVTIGGCDTSNLTISELRKKICIIPQEPIIFEDKTLKENLELFITNRGVNQYRIKEVLNLVKLGELINFLDKPLVNLSGGQKGRLSIARILLNDAPVLVLDEAFSAMDYNLKKEMQKLVFSHCKRHKKTVIMITHDTGPIVSRFRLLHLN